MLYYMIYAQLFLQPQIVRYKQHGQFLTVSLAFA